jgi:hypothetical protein
MSTKTLRKRIALVAVSALAAGLMSVIAVPTASAAQTDNVNGVDFDTLTIGVKPSTTGSGAVANALTSSVQLGWVTKTSASGVANNGGGATTVGYDLRYGGSATGIILAGAQIPFLIGSTSADLRAISVVVTGGTISSVSDAYNSYANSGNNLVHATVSVSADSTKAISIPQVATTMAKLMGVAKASAAAGSTMTIAAYEGTGAGTGITSTTTATGGALIGIWTLTVASASASGVPSLADSYVYQQAAVAKGTVAAGSDRFDNSARMANGRVGIIQVELNDAYTSDVTTGTLTATATNGSTLVVADAATDSGAEAFAATTSFSTLTPAAVNYIYVNQPVSGVAGSTTVTITHNGSVVGTKTLNWNGDVASITVDTANSAVSFENGATDTPSGENAGVITYVAKDAAGNAVTLSAAPTISSATGALVGAVLSTTAGTTYGVLQTSTLGYGYGVLNLPGGAALNGAGSYKLKIYNSAGTAIYSSVINATVSNGGLNSFTATWDKATYTPGEIAVLTVTGKDEYGNAIGDGASAAGLVAVVSGSQTVGLWALGAACDSTKTFSEGKFTCKFAANTEGAWSYSVDLSTVNPQSATVGSLKITSGGGVSNADVLKAIVSLIASINKQIAALQKALLKK